ncbi:hypothetical protein BDP27DRAFT_522794 [Rhodocollybia butyracea]|uniref:Uncharacterized protein n=1 Tax=Rhodocollybia butyracea TaxID=206335 RepID=A0A9P5PA94_9AGAR|nr:hypothetical protein BDP27DRAFT_522794 [Rhodocollybia butyracea]
MVDEHHAQNMKENNFARENPGTKKGSDYYLALMSLSAATANISNNAPPAGVVPNSTLTVPNHSLPTSISPNGTSLVGIAPEHSATSPVLSNAPTHLEGIAPEYPSLTSLAPRDATSVAVVPNSPLGVAPEPSLSTSPILTNTPMVGVFANTSSNITPLGGIARSMSLVLSSASLAGVVPNTPPNIPNSAPSGGVILNSTPLEGSSGISTLPKPKQRAKGSKLPEVVSEDVASLDKEWPVTELPGWVQKFYVVFRGLGHKVVGLLQALSKV